MNTGMTQLNWAIIACHLLGVVGIGVLAGFRRCRSTGGGRCFLADNTLLWRRVNRMTRSTRETSYCGVTEVSLQ